MKSVINRSTFISSSGISQLDSLNGQEENQSTAFTEQRELLSEDVLETAFTVIAGSAFTFNLMFCLVLLKKREMLRKPHNTLLFNLAITDFLTGVLLVVTPGYVSKEPLFPVPSGPGGHIFCSLLANRYLLFTVAKVSILLVTCLAVERWYCVMRPVEYKTQFDRKHLLIYILLSWVTTCALQSHKFMQMKSSGYDCVAVDVPYGREGAQAFIAIYSFIVFVSPCIVTWLTFAHIRCHAIGVARPSGENARREKQQKLVLRMCAITAVVITICWFPAQLSYSLTPFGITRVSGAFHKACNVIAFFNSCMNPFIYWYYHREYRQELVKLFHACKFLCYKDGTVINRHVSLHVSGQGIPQRQHQGHFCRVTMDELLNFSLPQNHQVTQSTSDDARVD